ncbi:MAG: DUF3159 domain-containing protein [Actinobacteria bacterium]|nr:DUF3159 domain-containing protein [Actinomycetota bacterium]MCB9412729.1 DUF3159 domain-containing protein [Actinomycetota bacterium]
MTPHSDDPIEERIEERLEELREDSPVERQLLSKAIGGWRGLFDSGAPAGVFVLVYMLNGQNLTPAVWSAVAVGAAIAVLRLVRREELTQIAGGFAGILISAFVASRTGQAEDFFLPGLLINAAYFLGVLISILVGWPALGVFLGGMSGSLTAWRNDPRLRRAYGAASWVWAGVFGLRLLVQLPLYFAGQTAALGVAKIVMGWPLFLLGAWFTFLIVRPVLAGSRTAGSDRSGEQRSQSAGPDGEAESSTSSDSS